MSHSLTGRFSVVINKHIHISPYRHTMFTFISLQHILVSLSKLLLLGTVGRQQTRYETGHGGGGSPLASGEGVSPQTTAVSRSATSPVSPGSGSTSAENAPLTPAARFHVQCSVIPGDIGKNAKELGPAPICESTEKESSVYLNEGYINVIYPWWLPASVCSGTHGRIAGCFICLVPP